MDSAQDFETARKSLTCQVIREVKNLREYLSAIDPEELENDGGYMLADAIEKIVFVSEGIKKINYAQEYIDAWEENGDPPQLNYRNENELMKSFDKPDALA